ncbi:MAG: DUF805 domain-containing protein [Rubricoccaceae bacterium]
MDVINQYFLDVIKNHYVDFDGRASRKEYWMFVAVYLAIYIGASIVGAILGVASDTLALLVSLGVGLFGLAVILPSIGIAVRRLHDTGRSGWFILLGMIPLLGLIVLYFMILEGDSGPNEYGPDPLDPYADDLSAPLESF